MLSVMVPMSSVMFMSVTRVLSVVVSVLSPQADTARAAPATNVPITSLERIARICSSLIGGFGWPWRPLIPKPAWTFVGYGGPLNKTEARRVGKEGDRSVRSGWAED